MARRARRRGPAINSTLAPNETVIQKLLAWSKTTWGVVTLVIGAATAIVALIIDAPAALQSLRNLPHEVGQTYDDYMSWVKEDTEWTGNWSSFPEGIVDMADMNLTDTDMKVTIWAKNGQLEGTIVTAEICKAVPFDFVLLRGEVWGDKANVYAFDIIGGHDTMFAKLSISREGDIMTVVPVEGMTVWFPAKARLGRHPTDSEEKPEPDMKLCRNVRASPSGDN